MKIYFACSITGGREFESAYQAIARGLAENGHNVLTAHLVESDAMATEAALTPEDVYSRDIAWIRECDVLIAEVSTPSHGVGYELGFALGIGKPVLALCRKDRKVTKMINGNPDKNLRVKLYTSPEEAIHSSIRFLSQRN
jgi:nucleoside 2-deoxyribosyltransferase